MLVDYFPPVEISLFPTFALFSMSGCDAFDYYFTNAENWLLNADFFLPRKAKTAVLIACEDEKSPSSFNPLFFHGSQEMITEQLALFFSDDHRLFSSNEANKELSPRETDVLQQIVKGITNKEIADKLNISLNTVLSHRKNITTKLGIKTVSGLTFYAIMNGLVSGDEFEL